MTAIARGVGHELGTRQQPRFDSVFQTRRCLQSRSGVDACLSAGRHSWRVLDMAISVCAACSQSRGARGAHSRRSGSDGLPSVHGKSPDGRQGVRLDRCIARAHRSRAPLGSSANLNGARSATRESRRQSSGTHSGAVFVPARRQWLAVPSGSRWNGRSELRLTDRGQAASLPTDLESGT